jgi:hypothetical protein
MSTWGILDKTQINSYNCMIIIILVPFPHILTLHPVKVLLGKALSLSAYFNSLIRKIFQELSNLSVPHQICFQGTKLHFHLIYKHRLLHFDSFPWSSLTKWSCKLICKVCSLTNMNRGPHFSKMLSESINCRNTKIFLFMPNSKVGNSNLD